MAVNRVFFCFTLGFIAVLQSLLRVDTSTYFSKVPQNVLYVSSRGTARFEWGYHVDNRTTEFSTTSPVWSYYNQSHNSYRDIGFDDKRASWIFFISRATCPPRLLNPDRVSRELPATLVISSVTTADNGIYRCTLWLSGGAQPIRHQVQLVVTVRPIFLPRHPSKTYQINEGQDLKINCTAIGPPTPNITWVNTTDGSVIIMTQGSGSAVLRIDNILRYHAGVYECQAKNNPNENWTITRTIVTVYYKPTIQKELSSNDYSSWNGRQVTLKCIVDGFPKPTITWYKPSGQTVTTGVTTIAHGSHVTITTTESSTDYGLYKCQAVNVAGRDEHFTNVSQLFPPGPPDVTISDDDIQASSVTVRWTKPGYNGGSPVIDYKVQINSQPAQEDNTSRTEHTFTGLDKYTKYEIRVYARNVVGYGNASIKTCITRKRGSPLLPELHLRKSKTAIILNWTKPDENGGQIESYTIYQKQGVEQNEWKRIIVIHDLSNMTYVIKLEVFEPGETYWFIVTATNEFGESEKGDVKGDEYKMPQVATSTPTPTTACGREANNDSAKRDIENSTLLAVFIALFVISLVIILLLLLYIWRNIRKKEQNGNSNTQKIKRTTKQQAIEDPVYDNAMEMEENQTAFDSTPNLPQPHHPVVEYEPIRPRNDHPIKINKKVNDRNTSTGRPIHYESITDSHVAPHQGQSPNYEPLRHQQLKVTNVQHESSVPNATYQQLSFRQIPTDYQSLQTYNNQQENQSTI